LQKYQKTYWVEPERKLTSRGLKVCGKGEKRPGVEGEREPPKQDAERGREPRSHDQQGTAKGLFLPEEKGPAQKRSAQNRAQGLKGPCEEGTVSGTSPTPKGKEKGAERQSPRAGRVKKVLNSRDQGEDQGNETSKKRSHDMPDRDHGTAKEKQGSCAMGRAIGEGTNWESEGALRPNKAGV